MYIPKPFDIADKAEQFSFIEKNAFGQLISQAGGRIFSTHMPFLLSQDQTRLFGHLAFPNPQHKALDGQEVLITLEGPHDYISPSWYESPGVPTWNYQAVHVYGSARVFSDSDRLNELVDGLAEKYESTFDTPWVPDYQASLLKAIVGVEVTISEIQCKYKLSQNRSEVDRRNIVSELKEGGSIKLAEEMERLL